MFAIGSLVRTGDQGRFFFDKRDSKHDKRLLEPASMVHEQSSKNGKRECFVVMPIGDTDGYAKGHFQRVYQDLVAPACESAGYTPIRADEIKQTNLIHLDILQKLIESPMVICDLSSRNPNVLFELGLRQAFDKPVVLIQEIGTPKIFDIAPLRYTEYRKERIYHEVLEDQKLISQAIIATQEAKKESINSIVKLLSITKPASLPELSETNKDPALQVIRAELGELKSEIRRAFTLRRSGESDQADFNQLRNYFKEVETAIVTADNKEEAERLLRNYEIRLMNTMNTPGKTLSEQIRYSQLHSQFAELASKVRNDALANRKFEPLATL